MRNTLSTLALCVVCLSPCIPTPAWAQPEQTAQPSQGSDPVSNFFKKLFSGSAPQSGLPEQNQTPQGNPTGGTDPTQPADVTQGRPPPTKGLTDPKQYWLLYDQGDHLRDLVQENLFDHASSLYRKHYDQFFSSRGTKFDSLLDQLATGLDLTYKDRFDLAKEKLRTAISSTTNDKWQEAKDALKYSEKALADFSVHEPIFTGKRYAPNRQSLIEARKQFITDWEAAASGAFGPFAQERNFFDDYPVPVNDPDRVIMNAWVDVEMRIRLQGKHGFDKFFSAYRRQIEGSRELQKKMSELYVSIRPTPGPTEDRLKYALVTIKELKELGLPITELASLRVGFVEVTSQTLLKEGQIEFPVVIEIDLPFKTTKTSIDEALGTGKSQFDYVIALDVNTSSSLHRVQKRDQKPSQFLAGQKDVPNPAYDQARMAVFQAQSAASANDASYCNGAGCIAKAIAGIAHAANVAEKRKIFESTAMLLKEPVYADYQFSVSDVDVTKVVSANYYVFDHYAERYFNSSFDVNEKKSFRLVYNLNEKDRNYYSHIRDFDNEDAIKKFDKASVTIKLSDVVEQFSKRSDEAKRVQSLATIREEMLRDKNVALAKYREKSENRSATSGNDQRFESVVVVMNPKGFLGAGFYVAPDLVLTNYHVIEGVQFVEMKLRSGLETFGKVVKSDVRLDLALLRVQARGAPVSFHNGPIQLGSTVEAIGHPKGLDFTITRGVVSAIRSRPSIFNMGGKEVLFVQTDTAINPGNSGGPLFLGDKVVGVNDNKMAGKGIEGIGFSIHHSEVQEFLKESF